MQHLKLLLPMLLVSWVITGSSSAQENSPSLEVMGLGVVEAQDWVRTPRIVSLSDYPRMYRIPVRIRLGELASADPIAVTALLRDEAGGIYGASRDSFSVSARALQTVEFRLNTWGFCRIRQKRADPHLQLLLQGSPPLEVPIPWSKLPELEAVAARQC